MIKVFWFFLARKSALLPRRADRVGAAYAGALLHAAGAVGLVGDQRMAGDGASDRAFAAGIAQREAAVGTDRPV